MKNLANTLILLLFLTNTACAEEASSPVTPLQKQTDTQPGSSKDSATDEESHLELMALTYKGKDPFGTDCFLYISAIEEEHEGEHHHELIAKLGYNLHGEKPLDSVVVFQKYSLDSNKYYPMSSNEPNTNPVLVSAILKDESIDADYNKLLKYEQSGNLIQSLRVDFHDMDFESFESALDEVFENNGTFEANKTKLDQLQRTVLKLAHAGHYDAVACTHFKLTETKLIDFELENGHEEDEDNHDHDHDH